MGLSAGVDYRKEQGRHLPNPAAAAFGVSSSTQGSYDVVEGYGEVLVPITNEGPGINDLELALAGRVVNSSTSGNDTAYQVGLRYTPVRDVVLRTTYSTAFRAPSLGELYGSGASVSYDFVPTGDPCAVGYGAAINCGSAAGNGDTAVMFPTVKGANPNVHAETAKVLTLGAVIEPRWVPNLSLTLGWYAIDLVKAITYRGAGVILQGCYASGNPADCALIHRDAGGRIVQIEDTAWNAGATRTAGLDTSARYNLATGMAGQFSFLVDGTFLRYYELRQPDGSVISGKGNYDLGVLPAFKGNAAISWSMSGLGAGVSARYIGSFKECQSTVCSFEGSPARTVSSYVTTDVYLGYALKSVAGTTSVQVGVQNVADTQPPFVFTGASFSTDPGYGYAGRFYYGHLSQRF